MTRRIVLALLLGLAVPAVTAAQVLQPLPNATSITEADCSAARLGTNIPTSAIGLPVSAVTVEAPRWVDATEALPARCEVDGAMAPVDRSATAQPINFRVWLPANWNGRAVQQGGGGMNGSVPDLTGGRYAIGGRSPAQLGFATYGSDSGHQSGRGGRATGPAAPGGGGAAPDGAARGRAADQAPAAGGTPGRGGLQGRGDAPAPGSQDWALNREAMTNLGSAQLKKTHDAAMTIIERIYGTRPQYTYFTGNSQGGREALTVAQRFPGDYDGVVANVPIVNFSSLMLAPELIRIQERPLANWVTPAKVNAIRGEFMRQCDALDGLADGVINDYMGCRAVFDVSQGTPGRHPWQAKRCPGNVDPDPADTSAAACLTDGQISTLEFVYRRYRFATPLANGVTSFGMWLPNTDPSGSGLIPNVRYVGQEGAEPDARMHSHLGILGVTGFLMQDLDANPLDYVEGGALDRRRLEISAVLDSTDPNLRPFADRGGKLIVTVGTNDTLASPGAQLDYYQSVLDTMGRAAVDAFARFFVIPQANHGLTGRVYGTAGDGRAMTEEPIASDYERFAFLVDWVERGIAPAKTLEVTAGDRTMPLCSYPEFPTYASGAASEASSYTCAN